MRPQPKAYARIRLYGLDDVVSLSDISRIRIAEATDANAVERCVIITYTDGYEHVFDTAKLSGPEGGIYCADLVERLSQAMIETTSVRQTVLAVTDPAKLA